MKIFRITHRDYDIPNDGIITPILVGMNDSKIELKTRDLIPSISRENLLYNELEAEIYLYVSDILKDEDIVGITQYSCFPKLTPDEIREILKTKKMIVHADYVGNMAQQYVNCHWPGAWDALMEALKWKGDINQDQLQQITRNNGLLLSRHIFITDVETFKAYMKWVLPIIYEVMIRINIFSVEDARQKMTEYYGKDNPNIDYQSRILGFICERLFTIWVLSRYNPNELYIPEFENLPKLPLG